VRASQTGRFVLPRGQTLVGRFLKQGDLVGYVVAGSVPDLRVIVPQNEVDLVRGRTTKVEVRYTSYLAEAVPARIARAVPAAQSDLPSLALATIGGGSVAVHSDGDRARAVEALFVFDVLPERAPEHLMLGSRVFVRFSHGSEPVFWRMTRALRQLFLAQFDV